MHSMLIIIICCYLLYTLCPQCFGGRSFYKTDNMGPRDKIKVQRLAMDLVRDAKLKLRQIMIHVATHTKKEGFHYGYAVGKMREIYRNMIELYRTAVNNLNGFPNFDAIILVPRTDKVRPIEFLILMDMMHDMEIRIDSIVDAIEFMPRYADIFDPETGEFTEPLPTGKAREDANKTALRQKEETLKSRVREQFLMKRLGLSPNTSTTRKRFIHKWPVEETWKLNSNY